MGNQNLYYVRSALERHIFKLLTTKKDQHNLIGCPACADLNLPPSAHHTCYLCNGKSEVNTGDHYIITQLIKITKSVEISAKRNSQRF